jgi:predicted MFS family arabinose efflux permease
LINLGLIAISLKLQRKSFAVFGAFGLFAYLGHLASDIFEDSMFFPMALAFIGVLMIVGTVQYQKHYSKIGRILDAKN